MVKISIQQTVAPQAEPKYKLLDKKDRKILTIIGVDPRISYTELSKYVNLSKNATKYRLDRLFKFNIIQKILPIFNYIKLGYFTYDIFLKCNLTAEKQKDFEIFLKEHSNIIWACEIFGNWDYYFELICKNPFDFDKIMKGMMTFLGDAFHDYKTVIGTERIKIRPLVPELAEETNFPIAKQRSIDLNPVKLDKLDQKIIHELCKDGRASYFEVGQKIGESLQTVRNRLRKLIDNNIIQGFMPMYGYREMGYTDYLLLLKIKYFNPSKERELRTFIQENKFVKLAIHIANTNEILLFVCTTHPIITENLVKDLKVQFPDMVQNVDLMHITNEIKLDFFPKGLF